MNSDILTQTSKGQNYIGPVYIEDVSNEPLTVIAVPVKNVFGDVQGTLVAEVDLKFMWDLVGQLQVGETGYAYVVDNKGDLIAFSNASRVLRGENEQQILIVKEFLRNLSASTKTAPEVANYTGLDGTTVVGTYVALGTPPWAVITEMPLQEAYQTVLQIFASSLIAILVIAVLAGVAGVFIARRLTGPLANLLETATRISHGELELQTAVSGPAEVVSLAMAFNSMTTQLRELIDSLEQRVAYRTAELDEANQQLNLELAAHERSEALFRALFELSPDAVVLIDPHDSKNSWPIVDCNAAACRMNGYSRDELIGHSIDMLNETPGNQSGRTGPAPQNARADPRLGERSHCQKPGAADTRRWVNLRTGSGHSHTAARAWPVCRLRPQLDCPRLAEVAVLIWKTAQILQAWVTVQEFESAGN